MNVTLWLLAGGVVGWIAQIQLHLNVARALLVSAVIGAAGAFFGGFVLTPIVSGAAAVSPESFSPLALLIASASALGCLSLADMVYERFGF